MRKFFKGSWKCDCSSCVFQGKHDKLSRNFANKKKKPKKKQLKKTPNPKIQLFE